jgi:predicted HTH domain antitoxin
MGKVHAVIDLPEEVYLSLSSSGLTRERIVSESRKLLALKFFSDKIFSLGKATQLSGLSKWDFIEYLSENQVPVVDHDEDEMRREVETAEKLTKRHSPSCQENRSP